ncbi:hypothetical protein ANCCAN_26855, partial [Ancylostoma caninum]
LDKTTTELLQVTKIAHPLCNGELGEILEQANHDDMCMRALSKLLRVDSTEVLRATNGQENSGRNASMKTFHPRPLKRLSAMHSKCYSKGTSTKTVSYLSLHSTQCKLQKSEGAVRCNRWHRDSPLQSETTCPQVGCYLRMKIIQK